MWSGRANQKGAFEFNHHSAACLSSKQIFKGVEDDDEEEKDKKEEEKLESRVSWQQEAKSVSL